MRKLAKRVAALRIWSDTRAQDVFEYALMAGFVTVAAGSLSPGVSTSMSRIFSGVISVLRFVALGN
jgi:hypothetical protein